MLDWSKVSASVYSHYGLSFEKKENSIRVFGTSTRDGASCFNIATTTQSELYGKNFIFSWFTSEENVTNVYGLRTVSGKNIDININLQEGQVYNFTIQIALGVQKLTEYVPYQGNTYTVQLGQTVYGGTLDVGTGTLKVTWVEKTIPDTNPSLITSYENYSDFGWNFKDKAHGLANVLSSAFKTATSLFVRYSNYVVGRENNTFISFGVPSQYASSPEQAGDYIRQYSPKVVYELATPEVIQLTPQQILAISGTNTIYADADDITVTGASDPIATITSLQSRVSALESAQTNM